MLHHKSLNFYQTTRRQSHEDIFQAVFFDALSPPKSKDTRRLTVRYSVESVLGLLKNFIPCIKLPCSLGLRAPALTKLQVCPVITIQ